MSRPSASMSTVKGFSLTFDDLAAFTNHVLYAPSSPAPIRDTPKVTEARKSNYNRATSAFVHPEQQRFRHRHSGSSTSSTGSWQSSSSRSSASPHVRTESWTPTSPQFIDHPPRRLTERERAALANYTEPEMDITDMVGLYRDQRMSFEPLR
ncbi:hypothetical protein RSOLAG1IB_07200 [Rhizoctonia solani AG-1 IB]|uniref:Uncharacterized protein n=1 Tax=Thanatephorus cucumeris (strain AG1-IB / isolate 7/3/14) TaxID=1108050 RepID=A0A0B7F971_THACB|nr:hypothetical protein RSOLAG1IB_07200 [Rhizoctonia solani AG-1 IB]